ncbi:unnamed protein product [Blepharisma stoltei]|uniref:Uncharacterized protein n=1 Tax=Blepharisma stoltei TaxID=1481888 RepID=A0AAU9IVC3_9CILI|nr:unnamed protein product [Blepharisma stoltei]
MHFFLLFLKDKKYDCISRQSYIYLSDIAFCYIQYIPFIIQSNIDLYLLKFAYSPPWANKPLEKIPIFLPKNPLYEKKIDI